MLELGALEDRVADLDKRVSVHEAVCERNQTELRGAMAEIRLMLTTLSAKIETTTSQMTAKAGGSRAVRETIAYAFAIASLAIAAIGASGHIHIS